MRTKRKYTKMAGVMLSDKTYDQLEVIAKAEGVSVSEFMRDLTEEKIEKLIKKEEQHWAKMSDADLEPLLSSLQTYLQSKLMMDGDQYRCNHEPIWKSTDESFFKVTQEFFRETDILFEPFKSRVDTYLDLETNCDCEILKKMIEKQTK